MKSFKKMLSLLLSFTMVVTMLTVTPIFAAENVCHIGSTYYTSLEDALNAYNNQSSTQTKTIELDADCAINSNVSLKKVVYTINGNGHVIYTDTTNSTSTYKVRGLQTNSTATVTFNDLTMNGNGTAYTLYFYAGNVTFNNVSFVGSSREAITCYDNTSVHNLTLNNCSFSDYSKTPVVINSSNAAVTIKDTTFSNNTGDYDVDYNGTAGAGTSSLTIDGTTTIKKLHLGTTNGDFSVTPASGMSLSSYIGLYPDTYTEGVQLLTGSNISSKYSAFKLPGDTSVKVDSSGSIALRKVARFNGVEYSTLAEAIAAVNASTLSTKTVTLIDDADVPDRLTISKSSVVITDDGTPRTIYVYNTDSSSAGGYGRGFQMQLGKESYTVTFKGTKTGYLTVVGHNADETKYNKSFVFAVRGGTMVFSNVIIKDCVNSMAGSDSKLGGAMNVRLSSSTARGNVEMTNCEIYNCQAAEGAAIYSVGGSVILTSTKIYDCASTGSTGAVSITDEPGSVTSDLSHLGSLYIKEGVQIYDNYKNTTLEQKSSGAPSNISVENGTQIAFKANQKTCKIGIDYGSEGDTFAVNPGGWGGYSATVHRDGNTDLKAKKDADGNMYWATYSYEVNFGNYTTVDTSALGITTYKYANATVTANAAEAVSIAVDRGSFDLNWATLSISGVTSYDAVLADGTFASGTIPTTGTLSYKGITLYGSITSTKAATLIKALVFTNTGSGIAQNITFGLAETVEEGEKYFAGSKYTYVSDTATWDNANLAATNSSSHLVYINNLTENDYVKGISGANVWTGAAQKLNAWYWNDGTKFAANATTNQGYNGAFVNWKAGNPTGEGERMILNTDGQWVDKDALTCFGYVTEKNDSKVVVNPVSITAAVTTSVLSSMNLSFDGDITMYYYFIFADDVKAQSNYKVVVEVGTGDEKVVVSSTIADMANLTDAQGNYGIKVPVPAKMMGADVKIRLCNAQGLSIRSYANYDGAHPEKNYNCLYYANYMYARQSDRYNQYYSEDLIAMITAMLNYGAAAQKQFGYDIENLVNAGHEDTASTMSSIPSSDIVNYSGTNFSSAYLVADSQTIVALTYTGSGTQPEVTFDGVPTTNFTYENKVIKIPVCAQNLGKTIEVTIGSDSATLNANYVLNGILTSSSSTSAQKLTADRLYKFGKKADTYFGKYEQNTNAIEAVLETAYAYLAKETYSQYDQTSLDTVTVIGDYPQGRRQLFASPEEMTAEHMVYMDCSSFCYSVYRNIYGADATKSAFLSSSYASFSNLRTYYMTFYPNSQSVVKTYSNLATDTWYADSDQSQYVANWTNAVEDAKSIMQPGDMLVYYGKNSSGSDGGHIVMWTGSGFIHCTGSSYDSSKGTDAEEPNGAVHFLTPSEFNYSFLQKHGAKQAVILRPLNVLGSKQVSDSGIARTQLGSVAVEATGYDNTNSQELYQGQYVVNGDSVTYTITLTNKQMTGNLAVNKKVNVVYTPSSKLTSITPDNGGSYSGDTITWEDVEVGVNQTVTLKFTGTVNGSAKEILEGGTGYIYLSDAGSVAKPLTFSAMQAEIETYSASSLQTNATYVKNNASNFVTTNGAVTVSSMLRYITGDSSVTLGSNDEEVFSQIRTKTSLGNFRPVGTEFFGGNIVSNFCGGNKFFMNSINDGPYSNTDRVRNIKPVNLKVGDIIITYRSSSSQTDYYVYVGGDDMIQIDSSLSTSTVSAATICERLNGRSLWGVFRLTK